MSSLHDVSADFGFFQNSGFSDINISQFVCEYMPVNKFGKFNNLAAYTRQSE